jgi:hypothetical protein
VVLEHQDLRAEGSPQHHQRCDDGEAAVHDPAARRSGGKTMRSRKGRSGEQAETDCPLLQRPAAGGMGRHRRELRHVAHTAHVDGCNARRRIATTTPENGEAASGDRRQRNGTEQVDVSTTGSRSRAAPPAWRASPRTAPPCRATSPHSRWRRTGDAAASPDGVRPCAQPECVAMASRSATKARRTAAAPARDLRVDHGAHGVVRAVGRGEDRHDRRVAEQCQRTDG